MTKLLRAIGLAVTVVSLAAPARAGWRDWWCCGKPCPSCPNDYCPKSLPLVPCPSRIHGPDDYCPKRLPCTRPVTCFGADDYCPRPCPITVPRCPPPWYSCGACR
jgi:hypothetical protein